MKPQTIREQIRDLGNRLYYCSDSPDGRKTRKEIERKIKQLEREVSK